jgi:hypothetical protein
MSHHPIFEENKDEWRRLERGRPLSYLKDLFTLNLLMVNLSVTFVVVHEHIQDQVGHFLSPF